LAGHHADAGTLDEPMDSSLTLRGWNPGRAMTLLLGAGMAIVAALTIEHFFAVRFPDSIAAAAACEADTFFRCGDSANAPVSAVFGAPIGVFGFMVGSLLVLGALFPSAALERTNRTIAYVNVVLATALVVYSVAGLRSLCPLCTSYGVLAAATALLFLFRGIDRDAGSPAQQFLAASPMHLAAFAAATLFAAWAVATYHDARRSAESGTATAQVVSQFLALDRAPEPSIVSPYWVLRATDRFQDAPLRVIEYSDFLCSDCRYLSEQLHLIEHEFAGRINWAFQFFPLEAACNDVVDKDKHPGACDLAYIAAWDAGRFRLVHDEIFANVARARSADWRLDLARRHGAEAALSDSATRATVHALIRTGTEYGRTSLQYEHGIRSTPTLIINGRMIIGTLPYPQLRAILQAALDEQTGRGRGFIENWVAD
jgi:uncharacterized membrane protein/protein-disulfide isomerase